MFYHSFIFRIRLEFYLLSFYRLFIFGKRSEFYLLSFYDYYYYFASFTSSFTLLPLLNNTTLYSYGGPTALLPSGRPVLDRRCAAAGAAGGWILFEP